MCADTKTYDGCFIFFYTGTSEHKMCTDIKPYNGCLTRWGLVTPYGDRDLGQHWLSNGLLPDGTKPLPEPMLTDYQWSPVTFILGKFHKRCLNRQSLKSMWKLHIQNLIQISQGQMIYWFSFNRWLVGTYNCGDVTSYISQHNAGITKSMITGYEHSQCVLLHILSHSCCVSCASFYHILSLTSMGSDIIVFWRINKISASWVQNTCYIAIHFHHLAFNE